MKKIMIIDGSPRKNMNTAAMIEAFANGAKSVSEEIEVKTIRVYDMNCKGCVSCLACKLKNSKYLDVCARKDDFTEPLRETAYADGIVFASPMYFFQITAQLRAFIERLFFPWLSYKDYSSHPPKGRIPTAFIYTMKTTTATTCRASTSKLSSVGTRSTGTSWLSPARTSGSLRTYRTTSLEVRLSNQQSDK